MKDMNIKVVFDPDIKRLFKSSRDCMLRFMDLHDYQTVKDNKDDIQLRIEGYGFRENENYDDLEGEDLEFFLDVIRSQVVNPTGLDDLDKEDREFIEKYFDFERCTTKAMPPVGRRGDVRGPMAYHEILMFRAWVDSGMPERNSET